MEIIETPYAWLEPISEHVVVQRWKAGIVLDKPTIQATMALRHAHFGATPYAAIVIVPEGTRFAMSFLDRDQYQGTDAGTSMIAMANVVEEEDVRAVISLYYVQHPPAYKHGVFALLSDAKAWVEERLAERGL